MDTTRANRLSLAARRYRVPLAALRQAVAMLREQTREERQRAVLLRQAVWAVYAWTDRCLPFWRHGMPRRFPRAFGDGDHTLIPGFDKLAQALAPEFPEYLGGNAAAAGDDPAQRLFDFLAAPYVPLPTVDELLAQAAELVRATLPRRRRR